MSDTGIVVIGRNEGERLFRCLQSLKGITHQIVYVDSGSIDNSPEFSKSLGISVIELDPSRPFTAARARNEGFVYMTAFCPAVKYVQFVDGDCELVEGWLTHAREHLEANPDWAIACGRRKERYPDHSIYNRLCDLEWDTPIGSAKSCGGDFMIRVSAFQSVGGFNASLIAGEEPELGFRLRKKGWKIVRIDFPMTVHDAGITHFMQWWKKMKRTGYAHINGFFLHSGSDERYYVRETLRPWLWILIIPFLTVLGAHILTPAIYLCFLVYPLQIRRVMIRQQTKTGDRTRSFEYAIYNLIGKLPELIGQIQFLTRFSHQKTPQLIEYK